MRAFLATLFIAIYYSPIYAAELPLHLLKLPPGFHVDVYAYPVPNAREMVLGEKHTLFVGSRNEGNVYAILPDNEKQKGKKVITIASGLNMPNGVAFHNGSLYVAEIHRILRYDHIEENLEHPPKPVVVFDKLPKEKMHGWRFIRIGPDKKMYIGIGAPCNVCVSKDPRFATIASMNLDGSNFEIFAKGIRNTVGFDWHPITHQLWFTDNGRDLLGDDLPPDELNYVTKKDMNFGFPYCYGNNIPDPEFGKLHSCEGFTPSAFDFPAHSATLGMSFYTGQLFPKEYFQQIFIAEHGSWNRSSKVGYQVVSAKLKDNHVVEVKPFIQGWLQGQDAWGRPVATLMMPDGSLLISDDYANVIYRVSYNKGHI